MSERLSPSTQLAQTDGAKKAIKSHHLDADATLRAGQKIVVYEHPVPADKAEWFGYGYEGLPLGVARIYAALLAASDGSPIEGDLRLRVTDSEGDNIIASREIGDLGTLADAEAQDRTERPALPALEPGGQGHRLLQVVINCDPASDGETIDPAASAMRLWRTQA